MTSLKNGMCVLCIRVTHSAPHAKHRPGSSITCRTRTVFAFRVSHPASVLDAALKQLAREAAQVDIFCYLKCSAQLHAPVPTAHLLRNHISVQDGGGPVALRAGQRTVRRRRPDRLGPVVRIAGCDLAVALLSDETWVLHCTDAPLQYAPFGCALAKPNHAASPSGYGLMEGRL